MGWALTRERQIMESSNRRRHTVGPSGVALRPIDVVPVEVDRALKAARAEDNKVMCGYFDRALPLEPVVEHFKAEINGRLYDMPRVVLTEPASEKELAAMMKQYPTRRMVGAKVLQERRDAILTKIGRSTDYLLVDATGHAAAVVARKVFSAEGLVGKRALLTMNALMGLDEGFSRVCNGSGVPDGDDLRARLKHDAGLRAWGMPEGSCPQSFVLNGIQSGRLAYEKADGTHKSFQYGSWIARREVEHVLRRLQPMLKEAELTEYESYVTQYLAEAHAVLERYSPLLLAGAYYDVAPEQMPEHFRKDTWDVLSFLVVDSLGKSQLGIHTDTNQMQACLCSCDSMFAPGYNDYRGAELFFAQGMWAEAYDREDAMLCMGHESPHTILNFSVPPSLAALPMLRGSIVHWSHAGKEAINERDALMVWEASVKSSTGSLPSGQLWDEAKAGLDLAVRECLGTGVAERTCRKRPLEGVAKEGKDCDCIFRPDSSHGRAVVGELGVQLRLRGGGRSSARLRKAKKKRKKA
mmetsp:Transcript_31882/g.74278  ORF Transcript_31882/g.74278 Transcript_31882/m.74278 type:complete len:524 (-) Transcript_31882:232-1803(-)